MAKRRDDPNDEYETPTKKYKPKKQKKKHKQEALETSETSILLSPGTSVASAIIEDDEDSQTELDDSMKAGTSNKAAKKKKSVHDDTSSDEERWLQAIETGKLEEVDDELKKIKPKDPKLMTARQRAMYEKTVSDKEISPIKSRKSIPASSTLVDGVHANVSSSGQLLLALPNFKVKEKEKPPLTAEDIERSKEKAQKRKALADEKREKDKKKTMERLLKKQDSKMVKSTKTRMNKNLLPVISYRNTAEKITMSFPPNIEFPVPTKGPIEPPKPKYCGISGCKNLRKYSCSKTNISLCSLECYKRNVESVRKMIF